MIRIKISRIPGVFNQKFHSTNRNCLTRFSKISSNKQPYAATNYERFSTGSSSPQLRNECLYEKGETMASTVFFKTQ